MSKATLLCLLLLFGLAAGQLFRIDRLYNRLQNIRNFVAQKPEYQKREYQKPKYQKLEYQKPEDGSDENDAIIISDPNKFPNPEDETTKHPPLVLPDPETERPIGSHDKPSNGGFLIDIPKVSTPIPMPPAFNDVDHNTHKYSGREGEIPIENWDFSKKTTPKPPEDKGIFGNILGGWKTAIEGQKNAIENTYNSAIDAGGKWINATRNTADQLIDAKHQALDKLNVNANFLNTGKGIVDKMFDQKSSAWDNLHIKSKGLSPNQTDEGFFDGKSDASFTWNPPNDVASDTFNWVDWESDKNVTSKYEG